MNRKAYYGAFGGQYVAESLMNTLEELDAAFEEAIRDPEFLKQYHYYLEQYVGRETPLYYAERLSEKYGMKMYLKREDLNHTGAHKINNVIGQILLAKRMGKKKVIAETGAGQHGVATATGAALFDMECTVYMGAEDIKRQSLNVMRMEMLGAKVVSVTSGSNTLKDATNEAIRTWAKTAEDTFYIIGSAVGPYPYPKMVKEFQSVISREAKKQILAAEGKLPDVVLACVGGGSNSIGMFADFIEEKGGKADRRGGSRKGNRDRGTRVGDGARRAGSSARHAFLSATGCGRQCPACAFHLSRAGLSGRRSRARVFKGVRTRTICGNPG